MPLSRCDYHVLPTIVCLKLKHVVFGSSRLLLTFFSSFFPGVSTLWLQTRNWIRQSVRIVVVNEKKI